MGADVYNERIDTLLTAMRTMPMCASSALAGSILPKVMDSKSRNVDEATFGVDLHER